MAFAFLRLHFVSGPSTQVQWQGDFHGGDGCAGGPLTTGAPGLQTVSANAPGPDQTYAIPPTARSYGFGVAAYPGFGAGTLNVQISASDTADFAIAQVLFQGPINYPPPFVFVGPCVSVLPAVSTPCQYGTKLRAEGQFAYYLTPALIDTWLLTVDMPWLAPLFSAWWFTSLNAQVLCGSGPPVLPTIDLSTLEAGVKTVQDILYAVAWPNLCECEAGTPAPLPYPLPSAPQPTGWPTFPVTVVTTPGDPAAIQEILRQLNHVLSVVGSADQLVRIIQRWHVPFAGRRGTVHAGLSGQGSFAVSRVLGLQIDVTAEHPGSVHLLGNPDYIKDLGWISVSSGDGMLQELRVAQSHRVWLPTDMQLATLVGWELTSGTTITVTELLVEA